MQQQPLITVNDERGSLVESFQFPRDGQVFYLRINPHQTRGNHYHKRKTEAFLVINGSAIIKVRNCMSGETEEVTLNGDSPTTVTIRPNRVHSITALEAGATVIVWSNTRYNAQSPDTYRETV